MTDARTKILLAAERLFAERGVANVSLREIGDRAGQRNNSAVQYHFGDRSGLIQALHEMRMAPLRTRRAEMFAEMPDPSDRELVEIYIWPLAEAIRRSTGEWAYARFVARYVAWGTDYEPMRDEGLAQVYRLLVERLTTRFPEALVRVRLRMMQALILGTLSDLEYRLEHDHVPDAEAELIVDALIDATQALLTAPQESHASQ